MIPRNSFGSVRILSSGKFQARYTAPDGKRYTSHQLFPSELTAYLWLAEVEEQIALGDWEPPRGKEKAPTVGDVVQSWLDEVDLQVESGQLRRTTFMIYESICKFRILNDPTLSTISVDKLTTGDVAMWWDQINTRYPRTKDRNKKAYAKLKAIMWVAVEHGYLDTNPVHLRAAKKRTRPKKKAIQSTATLYSILEAVPQHLKLVTCLTLFHGLRTGEALALKSRHIIKDNEGRYFISVEGNLQRNPKPNGKGVEMKLQPPKTEAGYRTVPVLEEFYPLLEEHLTVYGSNPNLYLTRTRNDKPLMDTSFRSSFHLAKKKAGAPDEITPHYGRNWLITRLAETGATPKEIGRILGQEDVSTIVGVYMKVRESRPAELMSRVSLSD